VSTFDCQNKWSSHQFVALINIIITPLILAVEGGHTEVVKLLVENECDMNICDADGRTLLHRACRKGYADIAEILLKSNSNINQCNKWMKTPLILAVEGGHTKV
jgi:ankyrin repeat protein